MYLFYYRLEIFTYNYLFCTMPPSHGALLTASVADAMTQYNVNHTNDAAWTTDITYMIGIYLGKERHTNVNIHMHCTETVISSTTIVERKSYMLATYYFELLVHNLVLPQSRSCQKSARKSEGWEKSEKDRANRNRFSWNSGCYKVTELI